MLIFRFCFLYFPGYRTQYKAYRLPLLQNYLLPKRSPWCVINDPFYLKKKCFVLEISRFLYFCEIHKFQNLWRHHRHCYLLEVTVIFFWMLITIKMKFGQILMCCMTNTSNMFLAQCWRLQRPFYDFIKMTICSKIWAFLIVDIHHFNCFLFTFSKKNKTLES